MRRMISDNQLNSLKAPDVIITGVPESAVQGTLTQEQIEMLLANDKSRIIFNNEYYYLNDKFHKNGVLTYTHSGYDETGIDKYLNITVTTRGWVLTKTNISGGGSEDFKIIKLDGDIDSVTITQEQLDIFFPKDEQGNIHKPEYNIIITAKDIWTTDGIKTYYLESWNPTRITFNNMLINGYYSCYMGPNSNKFSRTTTTTTIAQHTLYIETNDMYFFVTIVNKNTTTIDPKYDFDNICYNKYLQASGWLTAANAPIVGVTYKSNENKFYVSTNSGKDYAFFELSDIKTTSFDSVQESI